MLDAAKDGLQIRILVKGLRDRDTERARTDLVGDDVRLTGLIFLYKGRGGPDATPALDGLSALT